MAPEGGGEVGEGGRGGEGAREGGGRVCRAMGGAQQPWAGAVEETPGLVVQFHGHMGAAVQIGMGLAPVTDGKGAAGPACVAHLERQRQGAIHGVGAVAQGVGGSGKGVVQRARRGGGGGVWRRFQASCSSQSCSSRTERATNNGASVWNASGDRKSTRLNSSHQII